MSYYLTELYSAKPAWLALTDTARHAFFAIWRLPDAAALATLLHGIAATGWHEYFETINAAGQTTDFAGHLAQLAGV